ncbi:leucine-rich repeat domain-containing protein [bacterium]|nr:leucine-rich repeat domain-containing protein [bacterium]
MTNLKNNNFEKWQRAAVCTSMAVLLCLLGCDSEPTFRDIEKGKIVMKTAEAEAVKQLLTDADVPAKKCPVFVGQNAFDNAIENHKILVQNEHVLALKITWAALKNMEPVAALTECRLLDFSLNELTEIRGLKNAKKLEKLILVNNAIKSPEGIESCTALKVLELPANELTVMPDISQMRHLERLVLTNNQIQSVQNFHGSDKLEHLDLSINQLASLSGLPDLPNLTYLGLENNSLGSLEGLGECPRLQTIKLSQNQLTSADRLASYTALESVDLRSNQITTLPLFEHEITLHTGGNPVAAVIDTRPKPKLVLAADAGRVAVLPDLDGHLSGGGSVHHAVTTYSKNPLATPSSFRYSRKDLSLTGTAGLNFIRGLFTLYMARVTIYTEEGRVRVYLKHPGDIKFMEDEYGKQKLTEIKNEDFMYTDASPDQPCTLQGLIMRPNYFRYEVVLQALDGKARGVSYIITDVEQQIQK